MIKCNALISTQVIYLILFSKIDYIRLEQEIKKKQLILIKGRTITFHSVKFEIISPNSFIGPVNLNHIPLTKV